MPMPPHGAPTSSDHPIPLRVSPSFDRKDFDTISYALQEAQVILEVRTGGPYPADLSAIRTGRPPYFFPALGRFFAAAFGTAR
jgi:hypothetical protein